VHPLRQLVPIASVLVLAPVDRPGETHLSCVVLPLLATIGFIVFVAEELVCSYAEASQRGKREPAVASNVQSLARGSSMGGRKNSADCSLREKVEVEEKRRSE
jgi:hypothetical protein